MSPTARSLAYLRREGLTASVTERWNQYAHIRQDLFGFCDLIYLGRGIVAVQVTSSSNAANRMSKILAEKRALQWIQAGGQIEVHAWSKRGSRGKRKLWTLDVRMVNAKMFTCGSVKNSWDFKLA